MKFQYRFYEGNFLPIVLMSLKGREGWLQFKVYVDTGASFSLFPADVADLLGITIENGEYREMTVGDGNSLKVYLHKIPVSVAGKEIIASIGFTRGLGVGFYIMGRKDIFEHFIICFHEKDKWIEFTPREK